MILYALACDAGHRFDSWFRDSLAYDEQAGRGLLVCPVCASTRVAKALMAPAVVSKRATALPARSADDAAAAPGSRSTPASQSMELALLDDKRRELRAAFKAFRDKVLTEAQDVGSRFPQEARRIHEGESPERQIRGQATPAEARDLLEDGILILPLPPAPEAMN